MVSRSGSNRTNAASVCCAVVKSLIFPPVSQVRVPDPPVADFGMFRKLAGSQRQMVTCSPLVTVSWFEKTIGLTSFRCKTRAAGRVCCSGQKWLSGVGGLGR
jgi:hypothetical protein